MNQKENLILVKGERFRMQGVSMIGLCRVVISPYFAENPSSNAGFRVVQWALCNRQPGYEHVVDFHHLVIAHARRITAKAPVS